jgi:hypothetical protein
MKHDKSDKTAAFHVRYPNGRLSEAPNGPSHQSTSSSPHHQCWISSFLISTIILHYGSVNLTDIPYVLTSSLGWGRRLALLARQPHMRNRPPRSTHPGLATFPYRCAGSHGYGSASVLRVPCRPKVLRGPLGEYSEQHGVVYPSLPASRLLSR